MNGIFDESNGLQVRFVNKSVENKFVPSRYMRRASKVIVHALHEGQPMPWGEVKALESLRGTESVLSADIVLGNIIERTIIRLPPRPASLLAGTSREAVNDGDQVSEYNRSISPGD